MRKLYIYKKFRIWHFTLMPIRIPFALMRIRILLLSKVMRISNHWPTTTLKRSNVCLLSSLLSPHCSKMSLHGSMVSLHNVQLFTFDADPDLALDFDSNPDPAVTMIPIRRNRLSNVLTLSVFQFPHVN
jgi:hypothetical protein